MIAVDATDMIGLVNATASGDLFGIQAVARLVGMDAHGARAAGLLDLHMHGLLTGVPTRHRIGMAKAVGKVAHYEGQPLLDELACDLMIHAGLDPVALCAIALRLNGAVSFRTGGPAGDMLAVVHAPEHTVHDATCLVAMHLGGGAAINIGQVEDADGKETGAHGLVIISDHPSSVLAAMSSVPEGAKLSTLVRHPVLDAWDITLGRSTNNTERVSFEAFWTPRRLSPKQVGDRPLKG